MVPVRQSFRKIAYLVIRQFFRLIVEEQAQP